MPHQAGRLALVVDPGEPILEVAVLAGSFVEAFEVDRDHHRRAVGGLLADDGELEAGGILHGREDDGLHGQLVREGLGRPRLAVIERVLDLADIELLRVSNGDEHGSLVAELVLVGSIQRLDPRDAGIVRHVQVAVLPVVSQGVARVAVAHDQARGGAREDSADVVRIRHGVQVKALAIHLDVVEGAAVVEGDLGQDLLLGSRAALDVLPVADLVHQEDALDARDLLEVDVAHRVSVRVLDVLGEVGPVGIAGEQDTHGV